MRHNVPMKGANRGAITYSVGGEQRTGKWRRCKPGPKPDEVDDFVAKLDPVDGDDPPGRPPPENLREGLTDGRNISP